MYIVCEVAVNKRPVLAHSKTWYIDNQGRRFVLKALMGNETHKVTEIVLCDGGVAEYRYGYRAS